MLVTIDTLRADRVGVYGGPRDTTPHLDRIAREGAYAASATAHVPLTRPSHATLFSGLLPWQHGVRDNISPGELPPAPLLAEVLKAEGFATGAFVSAVVLAPHAGLGRGFDVFSDDMPAAEGAAFVNTLQRRGDHTLGEALRWIEEHHARGRLFAWLHLYDPHDPYEPPEPWASRFAGRAYDGEVAFADELVGRLDAALARLGRREDTLLVVTSDHGEGLGEHGETLHGFFVYQTTLAVPLIVRGPGVKAGARLGLTTGLVDLYRTVLDLAGVAVPATSSAGGRSLAAALRGGAEPPEAAVYAESLVPLLHFGWSDLRVLREGRWKYVQAPRAELFDLAADPGESRNLAAAEPARAAAFQRALARLLAEERQVASAGGGSVPLDLLEKLGALGYVGGLTPAQTSTP
ncbi:MAG TPA: sulfatase, partial [Vicinamibacteria bacterium]